MGKVEGLDTQTIPVDFPFESKYLRVKNSNIHYIDEGKGDPIVFLHGIPTYSYSWRNIIPALTPYARCIAPDLIGMGKSDKPDISYRIFDHIEYIEGFIKALNLKNITFVLHGWGSIIGFNYAVNNENNTKAIAFYESFVRPINDWDMLPLPMQELVAMLSDRAISHRAIIYDNYFIEKILPMITLRRLTSTEMEHYRRPFPTPESRKPLWQFLLDIPVNSNPTDASRLIENYSEHLQQIQMPKLLLYTIPGLLMTVSTIEWCLNHFPNLTLVDLGEALHYVLETNPYIFAEALTNWYKTL